MNGDSASPSTPFSPETQAEIIRRFGDKMADVVAGAMTRALREVAIDARSAGVRPEEAVIGFLHLCRDMHESLMQTGGNDGDRQN
ncbi:MAG: hypothetical protein EOP86_06175 [Verrucomicrobiaceae bacterium]|nr:MAG: hypothetical protein EOP86_06175 [Verrucomicrobiaceae bacterium]